MEAFCAAEGIAHEMCGKVIVAVCDADLPALQRIYERGQANGVNPKRDEIFPSECTLNPGNVKSR